MNKMLSRFKILGVSGLLAFTVGTDINSLLAPIDPSSLEFPRGGEERATGVYSDIHDCREQRSQQSGKPKCAGYNPVGTITGSFSVNQTGAATYAIPISAPPGTAGMSPQLSIVYNSQHNNGVMGMGFSLEGLTAITRCPSTLAQNGTQHNVDYTDRDLFCFNGQQLVAIKGAYGADGTEYRTYINSFAKIISYGRSGNGPVAFKVWTKGGQSAEYGFAENSRIYAQGKNSIATWALNKISDTAGNYLTVTYTKDDVNNGEYHPREIDYTANDNAKLAPYNSIRFFYTDRADKTFAYTVGSISRLTQRLSNIQTFAGTQLVSDYRFTYEQSPDTNRSRLTSMQHCDNAGNCLPPTKFNWRSGGDHWWKQSSSLTPPDIFAFTDGRHAGEFVDLNADGIADYVMSFKDKDGHLYCASYINSGHDWHHASILNLPEILTFDDGEQAATLVDLRGLGFPDYAMSFKNKNGSLLKMTYVNNGYGWTRDSYLDLPDVITYIGGQHVAELVDILGNGLNDYVMAFTSSEGKTYKTTVLNNGSSWYAMYQNLPGIIDDNHISVGAFANLNGEGPIDFIYSVDSYVNDVYMATPNGWVKDDRFTLPVYLANKNDGVQGVFVDLNGDGLPDYVSTKGTWLNTGAGWVRAPQYDLPAPLFDGKNIRGTFVDLIGSGTMAYIVSYDGDNRTWIHDGYKWVYTPNYNLKASMHIKGKDGWYVGQFADLTGSGFLDYAVSYYDPDKSTTNDLTRVAATWLNGAQKPDLLASITDGYNSHVYLTYKPITDKSVYTKESGAKFPINDIQSPIYVVSETQSEHMSNAPATQNSNNGMHVTDYKYSGAKIHRQGWGFLGFRTITATTQFTGISGLATLSTVTTYSQNINDHTVGQQLSSNTYLTNAILNNVLLSSIQNTLDTKVYGDGSLNHTYYFPYIKQTATQTIDYRDYNEGVFNTKSTSTTLDDYGNPTQIVSMVQSNIVGKIETYTTTTQNTFENNPDTWILGNLVQSSVTVTAPDMPAQTRTSSFVYDKTTGMLLQSIVEPNDPQCRVVTTNQRDVFGNVIKVTVSGQGIADRTTTSTYDPQGRFVIQSTNALGQSVYQKLDPRFGKPTQTTDLNNVNTYYQYDNFGNLVVVTHPDNTQTTTAYSWCGQSPPTTGAVYSIATHSTDGITKTVYFDNLSRQVAANTQGMDGQGIWSLTQYDDAGRIALQSLPYFGGQQPLYKKFTYDDLGRLVQTDMPDGSYSYISYIKCWTITFNALDHFVTKQIDARGHVVMSADTDNNMTKYVYDAYGNLIKTTDSYGRVLSTITYDKLGRKIASDDADKGHWTYNYDVLGRLISQTDAMKHTTTMEYDKLGRMVKRTDGAGTSVWEYDTAPHGIGKLAKVTSVTSNKGQELKANALDLIKAARDNLVSYTRSYTYDELSRPTQTTTTINDQNYISSVIYDKDSRPDIQTDAAGLKTKNNYNALGFLVSITNATTGQRYWQLNSQDAAGHITSETHSNGLVTNYTYDPKSQYLTEIKTVLGQSAKVQQQMMLPIPTGQKFTKNPRLKDNSAVQDIIYTYDDIGNVLERKDVVNNRDETFYYDGLNRIKQYTVNGKLTQTYTYDKAGNITSKSDVGSYKYGENGAGPHAVTSISGVLPSTFQYNANGDQISGTINGVQRTIDYTSYSKPKEIKQQDNTIDFYYDADRDSFERVDQTATSTTTTLYLAGLELVTHNDGKNIVTEHKHYIGPHTIYIESSSDNKINEIPRLAQIDSSSLEFPRGAPAESERNVLGIHEHREQGRNKAENQNAKSIYEMLNDNIGSMTDITDANSNVVAHYCYTPFGEQVQTKGDAPQYPITHNGFTGHEEIEKVKLIHMGGRIYDPVIGRFLTADPFVQDPENGQSLNRYSYCLNSPLMFTDASGFGWISDVIHDIGHFFSSLFNDGAFLQVLSIVLTAAITGGLGITVWYEQALVNAGISGLMTGVSTHNWNAALLAAGESFAGACAMHYTGDQLASFDKAEKLEDADIGDNMAKAFEKTSVHSLVHGIVGGGIQCAEGGSFKDGFIGGATTDIVDGYWSDFSSNANTAMWYTERTATAAVVGGTAVALTGGNFWNGAQTAAMAEMYNALGHITTEYFHNTYKSMDALATAMGPNAVAFGIRPLDILGNTNMDDTDFLANHDLGGYHENVFWTDSEGHLAGNADYSPQGINPDKGFPKNISQYRFSSSYSIGEQDMNIATHPPGFSGANYNFFTHNCQDYSDTVRQSLNIAPWHN